MFSNSSDVCIPPLRGQNASLRERIQRHDEIVEVIKAVEEVENNDKITIK
ncbi:MAG: hypothetical protein ACRCUY_09290 [Thermoguttaceae bacterium]